MNNSNKLVLPRAIAMVFFLSFSVAYSQSSDISIKIDTAKKEILTYVKLSELPSDVDLIWQQKIPKGTQFSSYPSSPTNSKMIVLNFSKHLHASTMSFSFVCKVDSLGETLSWGESALIYTDAKLKEHVVNFFPKTFIVAECLSNFSKPIENSLTGSGGMEPRNNTIVVAVTPKADANMDYDDEENEINNNENEISTSEKITDNYENKVLTTENVVENKNNEIVAAENTEIKEEIKINRDETITTTTVAEGSTENIPENQTIIPVAQEIENDSSEDGSYCIQLFALKNKRTVSDVKNLVHIQGNDDIMMRQKDVLFVYLVGMFSSKKEADKKLEYYKKYAPGAFVTKL